MVNGAKSISQEGIGVLVIDESGLGQREHAPAGRCGCFLAKQRPFVRVFVDLLM